MQLLKYWRKGVKMLVNRKKLKILEAENKRLKELVNYSSIEELTAARDELYKEINNLKELKERYEQVLSEVQASKHIFEQKLEQLLNNK